MLIILKKRNCCLSLRRHECFSCWPQHCQGQHILGKPCGIKRAAPPLQAPGPQTSPECSFCSSLAAGHTLCTHKVPADFSKCQFSPQVHIHCAGWKQGRRWQREHSSYSLESYSTHWARVAPDCAGRSALEAPHMGGLAGSWPVCSRRGPSIQWVYITQTFCQLHTFLSCPAQPCSQSAVVNTAPNFCWQSIFLLCLTFSLSTAWSETQRN